MSITLETNFIRYKKVIKKLFEEAYLLHNNSSAEVEVSLNYVNEEEIRKLNLKHRGVDKPTDVLSFPLEDEFLLGDIIICKKIAKRQAGEYKHSFEREVCFLALHGFLHLLGYDHITEADEKKMQNVSDKILERCGVKR